MEHKILYCTLFTGVSFGALSGEQLRSIEATNRFNCRRDSMTGMLLYRDGEFMQILEGVRRKVEDERQRIALDHQHRNVTTLLQCYIPVRQFSRSDTCFYNLSERDPLQTAAVTSLHPFSHLMFRRDPGRALELLLSYRNASVPSGRCAQR